MSCSLCKSVGTTKTTCPDNPLAKTKDYVNHNNSRKQQKYIMFLDRYLVPREGSFYISLSDEPFMWLVDMKDSSITDEDNILRWDTNGKPKISAPVIRWKCRNNANQTSFTIGPNGNLNVRGGIRLTVKNNRLEFGKITDTPVKIYNIPLAVHAICGTRIKFVSYNILTGLSSFENDFRQRISKQLRTWGLGREKLVKSEILKADIAVVVECTKAQLAYILDGTDKFDAHIRLKIGENDGTAILFNKSRFELVKKHKAKLTDLGGQIVLNVALLDKRTQQMLCVTGLHLKSGDAAADEERRLVELKSAIEITDEFIAEYGTNVSQVLSGDLNSDLYRYKSVVSLLTRHGYKNIGDNRPTYCFWQTSVYDYIFIKGHTRADSYDVDDVNTICPNNQQGSDHLAVRCNLSL